MDYSLPQTPTIVVITKILKKRKKRGAINILLLIFTMHIVSENVMLGVTVYFTIFVGKSIIQCNHMLMSLSLSHTHTHTKKKRKNMSPARTLYNTTR